MSQQDAERNPGNSVIPFQKDSRLLGTGIRTGYTEQWRARRIANDSNPLTRLPGEILLSVMDHLPDADKFLMPQVSFRLWHLSTHASFRKLRTEIQIDRNTAAPTSGGEIAHYIPSHTFQWISLSLPDRKKVKSVLRSRNTCRPCLERMSEVPKSRQSNRRLAGHMFCTGCKIHHKDFWFSPEQKAWRRKVCLGREGKVRICPHQLASLSTVESWFPALTGKEHATKVLVCQECASAAEFKEPRVPPTVFYEEADPDDDCWAETCYAEDAEDAEDKENVEDLGNTQYPWSKYTWETEDPESKDPESKDPESKDPESKDPESKDPESKDPESKDPESKDAGFAGFEDPESEFPDYTEYIDEAGETQDFEIRRDTEPTLRGKLKIQWTATVLTLSEGEILTKDMIRAALKAFDERHKGLICAHASFDLEQLIEPFYWNWCLCFREPSELCTKYHLHCYDTISCFCVNKELPDRFGTLPASDCHRRSAHEHPTSCQWCSYHYFWKVDGLQLVLGGYTTALSDALRSGSCVWQAARYVVTPAWIDLLDPSTVKRDESMRHVEWCDDCNCVYATRALRDRARWDFWSF